MTRFIKTLINAFKSTPRAKSNPRPERFRFKKYVTEKDIDERVEKIRNHNFVT